MKKSAVVVFGVFAAGCFGAAVGFCLLWRSSAREAERSKSRLAVTSARLENTVVTVDKLEDEKRALARKLEDKTQESKELEVERHELLLWHKDNQQKLRKLSDQLLRAEVELQRARAAPAERDRPDKKGP